VKRWRRRYREFKREHPGERPTFYANRHNWI